jgi:sn-glycerol 3-phosphate transport system permease protein
MMTWKRSPSELLPGTGRRRDVLLAGALLAPSAAVLGVFVIYPLARAIWLGRQRCDALAQRCRPTGWRQYLDVATSEEFTQALLVTIKFAMLTVPSGVVLGLGLAVLADRPLRGMAVFRTVFSSTIATSVAVASLMWLFLLQPSRGALANVGWIQDIFPVVKRPGLLNDPGTALSAVALSSVWANLGFTFVVVTAGLQSIPRDLVESAVVDGARAWRRFVDVTLPLLAPTLVFVSVVLVARAFQAYGEIDLLTAGGPQPQASTTTLTYLVYGRSSLARNDAGLQSAVAVWLFIVLLVISVAQLWLLERRATRR